MFLRLVWSCHAQVERLQQELSQTLGTVKEFANEFRTKTAAGDKITEDAKEKADRALTELGGAPKLLGRLVEVALAPAEHPSHHVGEAELSGEALAFGEAGEGDGETGGVSGNEEVLGAPDGGIGAAEDGRRRDLDRLLAFDDIAVMVDPDQVGDFDLTEVNTERVYPE